MALIKCDECGNEVSDKASACPKCGNPIVQVEEVKKETKVEQKVKKGKVKTNTSVYAKNSYAEFIFYLIMGIIGFLMFWFSNWHPLMGFIGFVLLIGSVPLAIKAIITCSINPVIYYQCPNCERNMNIHYNSIKKAPYDTYETKCGYCFSKITIDPKNKKVTAEEQKEE